VPRSHLSLAHISSTKTSAPDSMASKSRKSPSQCDGLHVTTMRASRIVAKYLRRRRRRRRRRTQPHNDAMHSAPQAHAHNAQSQGMNTRGWKQRGGAGAANGVATGTNISAVARP